MKQEFFVTKKWQSVRNYSDNNIQEQFKDVHLQQLHKTKMCNTFVRKQLFFISFEFGNQNVSLCTASCYIIVICMYFIHITTKSETKSIKLTYFIIPYLPVLASKCPASKFNQHITATWNCPIIVMGIIIAVLIVHALLLLLL